MPKKLAGSRDKDRFFFHRTQFLALLRLALLYGCSPSHTEVSEEKRREIVARCLLGISHLIYETENVKREPSFDINALVKKLTFDFRRQLVSSEKAFLMNLFLVYHNHLTENLSSLFGRHKDMLFDIPNGPTFIPQGVSANLLSDVLQLQFLLKLPQNAINGVWFACSLAYALVEGAAEVLEVPSTDLSTTVVYSSDSAVPPIILYDNVPGGAGFVARLEEKEILRTCLEAALMRVSGSYGCGENDSCYGCLRSYRNQFAHQYLRRGSVMYYLKTILEQWK